MIPFIEIKLNEQALDFRLIDKLSVDSPLQDFRQMCFIKGEVEAEPDSSIIIWGGYYPHGKIRLFKGILKTRKSVDETIFHTGLQGGFESGVYMDRTPQEALKAEFEAAGWQVDFQDTAVRHEVILSGGFYKRAQELAKKETPYRSWWATPEGKVWWGKVEESPRWNTDPIWLDTRQNIIEINSKGKSVKAVYMPWIRGGHCVIIDDPVDKQELIQSAVFNAVHSYEREKGFFTELSYM